MADVTGDPGAAPAPLRDDGVLVVPSLPQSIARIRRYAVDACIACGHEADCDTVALLVSEVATNALIHGSGEVRVRVLADGPVVRVEVTDGSPAVPVQREAGQYAEGGRGIALVDALAADWGTLSDDPGKTVWFEVAPRGAT